MRIRNAVVEYDLEEAAAMLGISPTDLNQAVSTGHLQYYYRLDEGGYRFHEASLRANKDMLSEKDYLAKVLTRVVHLQRLPRSRTPRKRIHRPRPPIHDPFWHFQLNRSIFHASFSLEGLCKLGRRAAEARLLEDHLHSSDFCKCALP